MGLVGPSNSSHDAAHVLKVWRWRVFFSYAARIIALVESVTPAPCQSVSALEKERERFAPLPSGDTLFEFQISKHTPAAI
jgi:hypothetical protein